MKIRHSIILIAAIFTLSSCEIFTTSIGKGLARDNTEMYASQNASDLIDFAKTSEAINDPAVSAQILKALGTKNNLTDLSNEDKNTVLELLIGSTITMDTISETLNSIQAEELNNDGVVNLLDTLLNSITDADTSAVVQLFTDPDSLENMDPFNAMLASMCIMAQVAKDEQVINGGEPDLTGKFEAIQDAIKETAGGSTSAQIDAVVDSFLGNDASQSSKDAFAAALTCISYYKDNDNRSKVEDKVMGNMSVLEILGAFN
ncbi:MAG: hypothetical protein KBS84_06990 [Treponema sp.]|nr:hypothetical protein [Candidatus Treponema scatequi]